MMKKWMKTGALLGFLGFSSILGANETLAAGSNDCSGVTSQVDYEIHDIQGNGDTSTLEGQEVTTCGTVYAVHSNGYWIQDTTGDGDPSTSEGIYVYRSSGSGSIQVGDVIKQTATVKEYYGLTELSTYKSGNVIGTSQVPAATEITPSMSYGDLESLEGMRVTVKDATVVAGSNKYKDTYLVPGNVSSRVNRQDTTTPYFKVSDKLGNYISGASTFDTVQGDLTGPFDYSYDAYTLQWNAGTADVTDSGHTENAMAQDTSNELSVDTFNVENYFEVGSEVSPGDPGTKVTQEEFDTKTAKLSHAIRSNLGSPDILALQEVENNQVLDELVSKVSADGGPLYTPYLVEGNDGRGIDVAYLVKDGVNVQSVTQVGKNATTNESGCGPSGTNLLFSRPPLVLNIQTDDGTTISIINNHFKSKSGSDACRNAQADFVADTANDEAANGHEIIVTGDLNSYEDEQSVNTIETNANLSNVIYDIPAENRFSYIYTGKAQFLDHILVSGNLYNQMIDTDSAKINPDFAYSNESDATNALSVSDHDPLHAVFNYGTSY
ncbi:endonuclease/exonuclease/phosphatase family protein [Halobacillus yeomjeoni]|uniref:endonuclease/exonuclease/phosphatase family protein n=1 Tax=Halobacillus yeomjeoni TaxID=311194 RepID=UPI001CD300B3|nr:endonuclease/exonuclease/phosphatase family protein [Halobacillus yeomjeoni]MCA0984951.1 endonuclease/exonuclease/phosphatase family protein [Halobacillus yeomjeoni]